jgi:hypothetical protein
MATLPMFNGKMYAIFDPELIQAALKCRDLSNTPFVIESITKIFNLSPESEKKVAANNYQAVDDMFRGIQKSMAGNSLRSLNVTTLEFIAARLNVLAAGGTTFNTPNVYLWLRDVMVNATAVGLYGNSSPMKKDPGLGKALWYI